MNSPLKLDHGFAILALAAILCVAVALSLGPIMSRANPPQGQSEIIRSQQTPSPDVIASRELEKKRPSPPLEQPRLSRQQLEELILQEQGGAEKLRVLREGAVPKDTIRPPSSPPPDVAEREKREKQQQSLPNAQPRPSLRELDELIMKQPGGAERLRRAMENKPPIASNFQFLRNWAAQLNPFQVREANAAQYITKPVTISLDYTPKRPAAMNGNNTNYFDLLSPSLDYSGQVTIRGTKISYQTPAMTSALLDDNLSAPNILVEGTSLLGDTIAKRYYRFLMLQQTIPANGSYTFVLNGCFVDNPSVYLAMWDGSHLRTRMGWIAVQGASLPAPCRNLSFTASLAAGTHFFYWYLPTGSAYINYVDMYGPGGHIRYKPTRPSSMYGNNWDYFDLLCPAGAPGNVQLFGTDIDYRTPSNPAALLLSESSGSPLTVDNVKYTNFVRLSQRIPQSGYYTVNINVNAAANTSVKLVHYGSSGRYDTLYTFGPTASSGTQNFAYLGYFTAGEKSLYWVAARGYFNIYQVNFIRRL